jgi:DNA-binding IclR family transcriptional regulator
MAGNSSGRPGRSVTSKVVAVLDAFTSSAPELSLNELARRTGLPLSTAYRLVSELVEWGGLERAERGGYRIGLRLWEIGSLAPRSIGIREVALPFMQDLYEATHENVQLAVLDGHEALYIEKITGRHAISIKSRRGGRLPLHATGVGKVLLAYADADLLEEVLTAGLDRFTPHTIVNPGQLRRSLAEVRRSGIAFAHEEMTLGSVSVASPVFDAHGHAAAAMSIVLRSVRADLKRLAPALRTATLCVSRQLRERGADAAAEVPTEPEVFSHPRASP